MIIKPQGKPVRRITIEVDANGQAQMRAESIQLRLEGFKEDITKSEPMSAMEAALILGQVLVTVIQSLGSQPLRAVRKNDSEKATQTNSDNKNV